jgi:hypothetical protein
MKSPCSLSVYLPKFLVFCGVRAVSKQSRRLVLPRTLCLMLKQVVHILTAVFWWPNWGSICLLNSECLSNSHPSPFAIHPAPISVTSRSCIIQLLRWYHCSVFTVCAMQAGSSFDVCDLCSEGARFESLPRHRLSSLSFVSLYLLVASRTCRDSSLNYSTNTSFLIPSISPVTVILPFDAI